MNESLICHYLGLHPDQLDTQTAQFIQSCQEEVSQLAAFRAIHQILPLDFQPLKLGDISINSEDLAFYFHDLSQAAIIMSTLGVQIDRRLKYYEHSDLAKAVVFDAVANAYLESHTDYYQSSQLPGPTTFRFAPGYGDIPLELNETFSQRLDSSRRIGLSCQSGGLFIPLKSLSGIVGIGKQLKKNCLSCSRITTCPLRKEGLTCYVND